ncbi:hypothetical protein F7P69_20320 [Cellulosimicrobium funkei]|nr:hypothetical protein [Cellulosimicrobium funkei]
MQVFLSAVLVALLLNLVVALAAVTRRQLPNRWVLFVLLTGTTGAALAAVLALLLDVGGAPRSLDIGLILAGLALVTTAVRATAPRRRPAPDHAEAAPRD